MRALRGGGAWRLLMILGASALIASLFLPWSHQLSPSFAAEFSDQGAFTGLPRDPTAWQVYSTVDVLLAVLGASVLGLAIRGGSRGRLLALALCGVGIAFVVHALAVPPTNGVIPVTLPSSGAPGVPAMPNRPADGVGETLALAGLGLAAGGLALSLSAGRPGPRASRRGRAVDPAAGAADSAVRRARAT